MGYLEKLSRNISLYNITKVKAFDIDETSVAVI